MPQAIAAWCQQLGHQVDLVYYSGPEVFAGRMPAQVDIVLISTFTQNALLAYAMANYFRSRGTVTVLGGPHSRAYPEDAVKYFDYCVGLTTRELIADLVRDCQPSRPLGCYLSAREQPKVLPGVPERWPFMKNLLNRASLLRVVPILGSLGCPSIRAAFARMLGSPISPWTMTPSGRTYDFS